MVTLDEAGWNSGRARVRSLSERTEGVAEHDFVLDFRAVSREAWKVLPDAAPHLLLHLPLSGSTVPSLSLVGSRSDAIEVDVSCRAWTVGVRLAPGALPLLTGLPAGDFTDRSVPARDLPGWRSAVERFEALVGAAPIDQPPTHARDALLALLLERGVGAASPSWVVSGMRKVARSPDARVGEAARRLGLSPRTLRLRSMDEIGLGPKRVFRIARLFHAIGLAHRGALGGWSAVARRAGYADQAHLVRDFRHLLGESPGRWARRGRADTDSYKRRGATPHELPATG